MKTETETGTRWQLRASGEFLWAYKRGGDWVPAGSDGTFGLNEGALRSMRAGASRALASVPAAPAGTLKLRVLRKLLRARQFACVFRMTPPERVDFDEFVALVAESLNWELARVDDDSDGNPCSLDATVVVTAGWQQAALQYADKHLAPKLDGLPMTSLHCLVVAH